MCGICGFVKLREHLSQINAAALSDMCSTMYHRGPDGGGIWLEQQNRCGLGHRRLSIVDLSDLASQPMTNEDGQIVVAFNGEIYNHAQIRAELEQIGGHAWKTSHSDTEVILHAYEQWGIACLQKFRGMFGIALWDGREKRLWLVRDRVGIKPLYYAQHNGILYFASEIKAVLKVWGGKRQVNERSFYDYLSFFCTPNEDTMFEGVKKLRPGCWMCIDATGKIQTERYWDVWDHTWPELYHADENTIQEALLDELRTAVKLRSTADVPVGVFLSGGIDSSTNAALFQGSTQGKIKSFCVGYKKDSAFYQNENQYARLMAGKISADYYEHLITEQEVMDLLPKMAWLQDEPIADPVCIPLYYLCKMTRDNDVTVAQVGEGSDELFWGYSNWKKRLAIEHWNRLPFPAVLKKAGMSMLRSMGKELTIYYEYLRRSAAGQPIFWGNTDMFYEEKKKRLLSNELYRRMNGYTSYEAVRPTYERFLEKAWEPSALNGMSYLELNHRLPELLLMRVDKMSMGVSLECRVPFLDHVFVEKAMSIPESIKTRHNESKHILKGAVRGLIPDEIIDRKKQGFGGPVQDWFSGKIGDLMRKKILDFADGSGMLNREFVQKDMTMLTSFRYWALFNFALWWEIYIKNP